MAHRSAHYGPKKLTHSAKSVGSPKTAGFALLRRDMTGRLSGSTCVVREEQRVSDQVATSGHEDFRSSQKWKGKMWKRMMGRRGAESFASGWNEAGEMAKCEVFGTDGQKLVEGSKETWNGCTSIEREDVVLGLSERVNFRFVSSSEPRDVAS